MILAINLLLPLALAIIMFALGLGLTPADFFRVAKQPRAFFAGAFAQMVLLPLTAFAIVKLYGLSAELGLGLMILSLCPGGPTSSLYTKIGKGDIALSLSLTAVITFVSIFSIPVLAGLAANHFLALDGRTVDVSHLAYRMVVLTALPALIGMTLRYFMPEKITQIEPLVTRLAFLAVAGLVLVALVLNWASFVASVGALFLACLTIMIAMLLAGLALGRLLNLSAGSTTAISVDTTMQNAAMGIIIGTLLVDHPETISLISVPVARRSFLHFST